MTIEHWKNTVLARLVNVFHRPGDAPLSSEVQAEIKRFSAEQREALIKEGYLIYELTGQSIKTLRDTGRKVWSKGHNSLLEFQALGSMKSEAAVNPNALFLPRSNNKTLSQQEDVVEKFSQELGKKVSGVKAIIGQVPDYVELAFRHLDAKREYLFGVRYNHDYARTKTPTRGSLVAHVGNFAADCVHVNDWDAGNAHDHVHAVPLVVPASPKP